MAISRTPVYKTKHLPINNVWTPVYERTDLHQIADMTDFIRNVAKAADAAAVRKLIDAAATNHGLHVPAGGDKTKFLRGDNTWQTINNIIGGGIIAQSLAQNGWVKFANGLIIQWVTSYVAQDSIKTLSIPIAFTSWYIVMATSEIMTPGKAVQQAATGAQKIDLTSFKVSNDNSYGLITCLLLGI